MGETTPRPWSAATAYSSVVGVPIVARHGQRVGNTALPNLPAEYDDVKARSVANAALICKCVNAHDALVAALKEADTAINPPDLGGISMHDWNKRLKAATETIRTALKLAGGEK